MTPLVQQIIDGVIAVEGGYTNNPNDPGGPTNYGITEKEARLAGYNGDMRDLPRSMAVQFYYNDYVVKPNFDDVLAMNEKIGAELIDSGINCGVGRAAEWLQTALNALNTQGRDYANISVDGDIGSGTLGALKSFLNRRGSRATDIMLKALDCQQGAYYISLAQNDSKYEVFLNGWLDNRIENVPR